MTTERNGFSLRWFLLPFSFLYGIVVFLRNLAFDLNLLKSKSYTIPVISVGNITVGGTGKTPQIEYLVNLLQYNFKVAVISRGYKRKTKGFIPAKKKSTPLDIGDEPYQIFSKFKKIAVAVCERRTEGIEYFLNNKKRPDVILLDDAYQHRYVKPGLSILLIDYNRPVFNDFLLPAGNLRENINNKKRADVIIVTKCNHNLNYEAIEHWRKKLKLHSGQSLFFSGIRYNEPVQMFEDDSKELPIHILKSEKVKVLLVTGIAQPQLLVNWLIDNKINLKLKSFPDHHNFEKEDISKIKKEFKKLKGRKKIILTTEKDAMRLKFLKKIPRSLKHKIYYIPISTQILHGKEEEFNSLITNYVKQNSEIS